jgi:hypothetical protein
MLVCECRVSIAMIVLLVVIEGPFAIRVRHEHMFLIGRVEDFARAPAQKEELRLGGRNPESQLQVGLTSQRKHRVVSGVMQG